MSTRSLRARLDRLAQRGDKNKQEDNDPFSHFTVDPELANALRDDRKMLNEIESKAGRAFRRPFTTEPDTEEERMLRVRIAERASTIKCPAGYGFNAFQDDKVRLYYLNQKPPRWFEDLKLNGVKDPDAKEAQLIARIEAFKQTPEGRARARIWELQMEACVSEGELNELEALLALYPEPDSHPKDPGTDFLRVG